MEPAGLVVAGGKLWITERRWTPKRLSGWDLASGKVVVENNMFHRPAAAGILIEDDAEGWFESGPVRDMLIRNNRFVRCGISITPHTKGNKPGEAVHENIRIEDNSFEEGGGISARSVKGLTVAGNHSPGGAVAVKTDACTEVKLVK